MKITTLSQLPDSNSFKFERYGHSYHLHIETADDLARVLELDEAHWVATNAPIKTINTDQIFLELLDSDHDGHIRSEELKQGITWLLDHLQEKSGIRPGNTSLDPAAICLDSKEGRRIHNSVKKIFRRNHISDVSYIALKTVRQIKKTEEEGGVDTAGIVLPTAASDEDIREFLEDIIATVGGAAHPSGTKGVTQQYLDQFFDEIRAYHDWLVQRELSEERPSSPIMPFGEDTPQLYTIFSNIQDKIDQFFILGDAIELSPVVAEQLKQRMFRLQELDLSDSEIITSFLAETPIAWPTSENILDFETTINPYYAARLEQFRVEVLPRVLGETPQNISSSQWEEVKAQFAPYQVWFESKPKVSVESLPPDKLRAYLDNEEMKTAVHKLIQESYKTAFDLDNLSLLEKLILFQAYLIPFVNSFVSFPHLYESDDRALFEMGTLIMDGRHFTLSVKILDREQHIKFSSTSNMFVIYAEISDREGERLYEIAVPVTSGVRGNLQVNKRGIFKDIYGRNLHAKIVHIVENPISFLEALSAPFKRLGRAITTKLNEISSKAEQNLQTFSTETMTTVSTELKKIEPTPTIRGGRQSPGGLLAGGSIAIAALSSAFAFITKTFSDLGWSVILGGVLAGIIAIMLPTSVVAFLKLSNRDLSCILEGSGWGINARMQLTHKQATTFTLTPPYPPNSTGILLQRRWWPLLVSIIVIIGLWLVLTYLPK